MQNVQYEWITFYKEFAKKLLDFKSNRSSLVEKIKQIYEEIDISLPKLEHSVELFDDIDPFTTFGLFNKNSMTNDNRVKILSALGKEIGVSSPAPTTFNAIPTVNNQNATFYYFKGDGDRTDADIDNLWEFFVFALKYSENPSTENRDTVSKYFDLVVNKKGNGNGKITLALFWIAPETYLNLDNRNEWYIYKSDKLPADVVSQLPTIKAKISGHDYFEIVEILRKYLNSGCTTMKNFLDLSYEAFLHSAEVNEANRKEKEDNEAKQLDSDVRVKHYWIYSPGDNASKWEEYYSKGIMAIGWGAVGDLKQYNNKEDIRAALKEEYDPNKSHKNNTHTLWQFANEIQPGDVVFAKKGMHIIVGRGIVDSDYIFDDQEEEFCNFRKVKWTHNGQWPHPDGQAVMKTLTDITPYTEYVEKLNALFADEEENDSEDETHVSEYTKKDFLKDVYLDEAEYERLVSIVRVKKNVILQGAPGVGKTFAAKRLAYSMMGVKDPERVMLVQFHQSYSYEDFIEGIRPTETHYQIKKGAFYNFCKKAEIDNERDYFFIIDEINRGNLSKIFGELFMLIENDKRGPKNEVQLLYSNERFYVPENIHIIGMMNTADRSLAMLDYALRRRFSFYEMKPAFESTGFVSYKQSLNSNKFSNLVACVESLNSFISADESLGDGFCIGHSYFCNVKEASDQVLSLIVEFELIPLLKEYWFDEPAKVKDWSNNLRSSIK